MRIMLFAAGGDIGGGKTHILSLASELSRINDLRLVSFWRGVLAKEAGEMGIDTVTVDESLGISHAVKTALAQYDEFRPDIVHCHGAKANLIGAIVKARRGACVITTVHSDPKLDYMATPFKALTNGQINQLALRRMDHQVAVAGRMHDLLIERGFDPYNIFTIYNGLDFSEAPKEPRPTKAPGDPIVVGIAAQLNPVKNIEALIKAFAKA
jgi:glycosyltransferase involved in cell wall biosynthesis